MFLLFTILSKLMLMLCGMLVGAWIAWGYTYIILTNLITANSVS